MTMCEYHNMFTQLSRYALEEVDNDAKKQKCFLKGLNDDLQLRREMEEKKRKHDLQCQLRNTHPRFATQPEYQSPPMNLLMSTDQYQQPDDEVQQVSSQEPCLSSPTITFMKTNTPTSEKGYDCGEIEHYENNYLEKFVKNN